ncbi:MAG: ABC transporter ATP-binding protein [Bacillota bacterium]|jgi:tungstate transport system ATP-binding protein
MIKLTGLKKIYAPRTVLDIKEFSFEQGKKYALIGPNGCGKSTFLRILAGIIKPDLGKIEIDIDKEEIGYMPQKPYIFSFSAYKNVMISIKSGSQEEKDKLVKWALEAVNMQDFAQSKGVGLSGGEAQRLAFARMIVCRRKLLLLDEPTSATDIAGHELLEKLLKQYAEDTGCTVIFATHSLVQAKLLADYIIMMNEGTIAEIGPPAQLLENPVHKATKAFLKHWRL